MNAPNPHSMPDVMTVQIIADVTYSAQIVPPRCRKARSMPQTHHLVVRLPEAEDGEAPIVARITTAREEYDYHRRTQCPVDVRTEYRAWQDQFWVVDEEHALEGLAKAMNAAARSQIGWRDSNEEAVQKMEDSARRFEQEHLVVDGQVWKSVPEPLVHLIFHGRYRTTTAELEIGSKANSANDGDDWWYRLDEIALAVHELDQEAKRLGESMREDVVPMNPHRIEVPRPELLRWEGHRMHVLRRRWNVLHGARAGVQLALGDLHPAIEALEVEQGRSTEPSPPCSADALRRIRELAQDLDEALRELKARGLAIQEEVAHG